MEQFEVLTRDLADCDTSMLLALLMGSTETEAALAMRQGLRALASTTGEEEERRPARSTLLVALELARRFARERVEGVRLQTPRQVFEYLQPELLGLSREEMYVLCLSSRQQLIRRVRVAVGSVDQCAVDCREVWAPALQSKAAGIVLVHNHPSQDPEPSTQDVALTKLLLKSSPGLGIALLDHVVVVDQGFVSLRERGLFHPLTPHRQKWNTKRPC
jgi:DNA repair protein RadC